MSLVNGHCGNMAYWIRVDDNTLGRHYESIMIESRIKITKKDDEEIG